MKKAYVKPTMENETFVPNQFIAACQNPASYIGYCDISGDVYIDGDGDGRLTRGKGSKDYYKYRNTACNQLYESTEMPHFNAFVKNGEWIPVEWDYIFELKVPVKWENKNAIRVFNYKDDHVTQDIKTDIHYNVSI